jgi:hypothetical protein
MMYPFAAMPWSMMLIWMVFCVAVITLVVAAIVRLRNS